MKKEKIVIIIITIIVIIFTLGGIIFIPCLFSKQYNSKGISNILFVYIDKDREKEYVGNLNGYKIYVENLRVEELNYRTFNENTISLKDAINNKLVSINDWRRGAWYIFKNNDTEILRYESYEIAINNNECIIRPVSNYKSVAIKCHTDNPYRITLKKGNTFDCILMDKYYSFKIKNINKNNMIIVASDYGLTKVKGKDSSLIEKKKEFIIEKNKPVEITTQSMDYNESMIIKWR